MASDFAKQRNYLVLYAQTQIKKTTVFIYFLNNLLYYLITLINFNLGFNSFNITKTQFFLVNCLTLVTVMLIYHLLTLDID